MWPNGDSTTFSASVPAVPGGERYTVKVFNRLGEQLGIHSPNVYTLLGMMDIERYPPGENRSCRK